MEGSSMSFTYAWKQHEPLGDETSIPECPGCGAVLLLHQPDVELADRLLATCETCKSWFLAYPDRDELVLIPISFQEPTLVGSSCSPTVLAVRAGS